MKPHFLLLVTTLSLAVNTLRSSAATLPVTNLNDHGPGSLRGALATAADGDTINVSGVSGTILLTSGELVVSNSVTILGPGPANLAINGNALGRVFHVASNTTVAISGLTITNADNQSGDGGGIYNAQATLAVSNCTITGTIYGSGIYNDSGNGGSAILTIADCKFIGNQGGGGGAVWNFGSLGAAKLTVSRCLFSANLGGYGGGIANEGAGSSAEIANSTFTGNGAFNGGGISNDGTLTITNCIVSSNSAVDVWGFVNFIGGGGLRNAGVATVANTTFSSNSVHSDAISADFIDIAGGGINNIGTLNLRHCTIRDNLAVGKHEDFNDYVLGVGGGLFNGGTLTVTGTSIVGNSATDGGSSTYNCDYFYNSIEDVTLTIANSTLDHSEDYNDATYNRHSTLIILNSTLWHESLGTSEGNLQVGSSILDAASLTFADQITSLGYNLSSDGGGGFLTAPTDLTNTDPLLGPLQDNGGPTLTHALLPGSPAVDKGKNLSGTGTDQRGQSRTYDNPDIANAPGGDGTDIGACEVIGRPPVAQCKSLILPVGPGCVRAASVDNGSYDPDGGPIALIQSPPGPYPLGTNLVTLTAVDSSGASNSCTSLVVVVPAGAVWTVTTLADNGPGSLRQAIADACQGDTINFAVTGAVRLVTGELLVNKALSIVGPGATLLAIDGNASNRVWHIAGSNAVTISGLTITNGNTSAPPYGGGGIWNDHATVCVNHCVISGNRLFSGAGGGIYNQGDYSRPATLAVTDCSLIYNRAALGGGIYSTYGTLAITNSSLTENSAFDDGGAIYNLQGNLTIVGSILQLNDAGYGYAGGGIYNDDAPSSLILNSALNQNSAWDGGGIYNLSSKLTLLGCAFYNNGADEGGAVNNSAATLTVVNSSFSFNSATFGGAICNIGLGPPALTMVWNSTFSRNSGAGGLYNLDEGSEGALIKIGSTLLNADASDGNTLSNAVGTVTSLGYNLSSDDGGGCLNQLTDLINTDPMLGPLHWDWYNGGFTVFTQDLLPGSPAIDKGKNLSAASTDQRGQPRTYDNPGIPNATGGDGTDIGAFEMIPPRLAIIYSGNQAVVSWPPSETGWTLQTNNSLAPGTWGNYLGPVVNNTATNSPPASHLFFRLKQ